MAKIVTLNGRDWEILDGVELGPPNVGGRPTRNEQIELALSEAAANSELTANSAAKVLYPTFFPHSKTVGEQKQNQIKYIAKLIRNRRRGLVSLD